LTLQDGTDHFYVSKTDAENALTNYQLYSQITESTTELGKWVHTFSNTPELVRWTTDVVDDNDRNATSLYTILDHQKSIYEVGRFKVQESFIQVVEQNLPCCYFKGYPCNEDICSCKTAYNNGSIVIERADTYTMQQTQQFQLENIHLGTTEEHAFDNAIERILTFSGQNNKEAGVPNYQVGGSTFTVATINPRKKIYNIIEERFPSLDQFSCVVFGDFYCWSHLPLYKMTVRFDGIYALNPTTKKLEEEKLRLKTKWFGKAFATLQEACPQTLVVFELLYLQEVVNTTKLQKYEKVLAPNLTCKPTWVGCMKRKSNEPIYVGRILKGFFYGNMLRAPFIKKPTLQKILMQLATYGVQNQYGINKLNNLNNTILRKLLITIPQQKLKIVTIHRILNAARYQRKSALWLLVHVFFPASYGQYLRDDEEILKHLQDGLDTIEKMDIVLYTSDHAFVYPPYAVQVGDTVKKWQKRFNSKMIGSEDRFCIWKLLKDRRSTQGHMLHPQNLESLLKDSKEQIAITEEVFHSVIAQLIQHGVLKKTVDAYENNMLCFTSDYNMMYLLVKCVNELNISISVGIPDDTDVCLIYPTEQVLSHFYSVAQCSTESHTVSVEKLTNEIFHVQTLDKSNYSKIYLLSKKTLMLIGLENWPFDTLVFILNSLQKQQKNIKLHFFGYDNLPKMSTPKRRFTPLLEDLRALSMPIVHTKIDNNVDELMITNDTDLRTFLERNDIHDYVIVTHTNKDMEVVKQMQLGLPSETKFKVGDKVITPSGFISSIQSIYHYNRDLSVWGIDKHLYLGTEITLKNDTKKYRANKLKHAFVLKINELVVPQEYVIVYGTIPNYTKELFEDGFATKRLVYLHHDSLDDKISKQFNSTVTMKLERSSPFYACQKEYLQKQQQEQQRQQTQSFENIRNERKRKLSRLFEQQKKKHKEYGK